MISPESPAPVEQLPGALGAQEAGAGHSRAPAEPPLGMAALRGIVKKLLPTAELARSDSVPLESRDDLEEPPRLVGCRMLEGGMRAHDVGAPEPLFRAFLDGKQKSEQLAFVRGVPLIVGTVAAAIRIREPGGTRTWGVVTERSLYAPLRVLGDNIPTELVRQVPLVDTDADVSAADGEHLRHPTQLVRRAYHLIQNARERLEQGLVNDWVARAGHGVLLVDGSISRISSRGDLSSVVGLVKSHRTLYLRDDEVQCVLALQPGQRSSSFLIESRNGPVASWYLKLRRDPGSDPLWGLVRVEVPVTSHSTDRADHLSRCVMAETAPISLPDSRWDRLLYGVRDCEVYLSTVM